MLNFVARRSFETLRYALGLIAIFSACIAVAGEAQIIAPRWSQEVSRLPSGSNSGAMQGLPNGLFLLTRGRALVWTSLGLRAYTENGAVAWDYPICPSCSSLSGHGMGPVLPAQDGSVWFVEYTPVAGSGSPPPKIHLRRIEPDGSPSIRVNLDERPEYLWGYSASTADSNAATIFWSREFNSAGRVHWLRADRSGAIRSGTLTLPTPAFDYTAPLHAYALPDGDSLLVLAPSVLPWGCAPLHFCGFLSVHVLRVTPHGSIVWHRSVPILDPDLELLPQSSANGILIATHRSPFELAFVDESGNVSPVARIPSFGADDFLAEAIPLERDDATLISVQGIQRVDRFGLTLASRRWQPGEAVGLENRMTPVGILIARYRFMSTVDATLFDASNFGTTLRFRSDLPEFTHIQTDYADGNAEGMVWLLQSVWSQSSGDRTMVAAFALPGSVAEARVHRNGFDY